MGLLASLLPGLRELRAPLAAGYLWLATAWLVLAAHIPSAQNADGIWKDIYRLGAAVGSPGIIAAVSFSAYLIGVLTDRFADILIQPIVWIWRRFIGTVAPLDQADSVLKDTIGDALLKRYRDSEDFRSEVDTKVTVERMSDFYALYEALGRSSPSLHQLRLETLATERNPRAHSANQGDVSPAWSGSRLVLRWFEQNEEAFKDYLKINMDLLPQVDLLRADLRLVPARLIGKDDVVYGRWDQLRAESDFRLSITPPLLVLSAILAGRLAPIFWLMAIPCCYLLYQGLDRRGAAEVQLAESIRVGRVVSPPLERLKTSTVRWLSVPSLLMIRIPLLLREQLSGELANREQNYTD